MDNFGYSCIRKIEKYQNFRNLLVQKYRPNLRIIFHKCYLGDPLPRLYKLFDQLKYMATREQYLPELKIIWHKCSFDSDPMKTGPAYSENFQNIFLIKSTDLI